ncbi:MAG: SUMF1/EgtB/PvdO family nonheme iron enzyme [Aggregatilineales bacterium]
MTWKFFISYSRSVKPEIRPVIDRLKEEEHEVWWDADIPVMADWWSTILDKIEWCDIFIFVVSEKAVQSPYCMAELRYGTARNRPILPFIMDDHKQYTMPPEVTPTRNQYYVHDGDAERMYDSIVRSCQMLSLDNYPDIRTVRPPEPNKGADTLIRQFQQAVSLAEEGQFDEAIKRFRNVASIDSNWRKRCHKWEARIQSYSPIMEMTEHWSTMAVARQEWSVHEQSYGAEFDPLGIIARLVVKSQKKPTPSPVQQSPVITPVNKPQQPVPVVKPVKPEIKVTDILPQPFEWCDVPAGDFLYGENKKALFLPEFKIAKYPITYAQYQVFIDEEDGFNDARWWEGLAGEQPDMPSEQYWKINNHPRERVNWYDAMAFCRWLSWKLGGAYAIDRLSDWLIRLPTEFEWEKAARGTDGREYPYGNTFDAKKGNVKDSGYAQTTPVTAHPDGASPYDVYDMSGNVWEWCLTGYDSSQIETNNISSERRVLRGGSFIDNLTNNSRCAYRGGLVPHVCGYFYGFRVVWASVLSL